MAGATPTEECILLGRITKPHGIRGEVKIYPFSGHPENFLDYRQILLGAEGSENRVPYTIVKARVQGKLVLVQFEGCATRNAAETLVGWQVWLRQEDLLELENDEFYLHELEGKRVVTAKGQELGKVTGVLETAAHDILAITGTGQEYLVPVQKEFFVRIGDEEVVLDLPPGLLEINRK